MPCSLMDVVKAADWSAAARNRYAKAFQPRALSPHAGEGLCGRVIGRSRSYNSVGKLSGISSFSS